MFVHNLPIYLMFYKYLIISNSYKISRSLLKDFNISPHWVLMVRNPIHIARWTSPDNHIKKRWADFRCKPLGEKLPCRLRLTSPFSSQNGHFCQCHIDFFPGAKSKKLRPTSPTSPQVKKPTKNSGTDSSHLWRISSANPLGANSPDWLSPFPPWCFQIMPQRRFCGWKFSKKICGEKILRFLSAYVFSSHHTQSRYLYRKWAKIVFRPFPQPRKFLSGTRVPGAGKNSLFFAKITSKLPPKLGINYLQFTRQQKRVSWQFP